MVNECVKATKPGLYISQSCSFHVSHWVEDVEFESVIAVWASVFALKITYAQLLGSCIYATAVFGNEGPAYIFCTFKLLCLKQNNNICFFVNI